MVGSKKYLGDMVYAQFDSEHIALTIEDDEGLKGRIYLSALSTQNFLRYLADLNRVIHAEGLEH